MLEMIDLTPIIESVVPSDAPDFPAESPNELNQTITNLWSAHLNAKNTARATKAELQDIRTKLGEHLSEMKKMLASPGRDGQWSKFLREHEIPRATADRLVAHHQQSCDPNFNCLSEPVSEPTEEEGGKLFASLWPKLRRTLRSRNSLTLFIDLLRSNYECEEVKDREITANSSSAPTICPASVNGDSIHEPEVCAIPAVGSAGEQVI